MQAEVEGLRGKISHLKKVIVPFQKGLHIKADLEKEKELDEERDKKRRASYSRLMSRRESVLFPKELETCDDSDFFSRSSTSGFGSSSGFGSELSKAEKRETLQLLGEL